jgi:hypothetical protein
LSRRPEIPQNRPLIFTLALLRDQGSSLRIGQERREWEEEPLRSTGVRLVRSRTKIGESTLVAINCKISRRFKENPRTCRFQRRHDVRGFYGHAACITLITGALELHVFGACLALKVKHESQIELRLSACPCWRRYPARLIVVNTVCMSLLSRRFPSTIRLSAAAPLMPRSLKFLLARDSPPFEADSPGLPSSSGELFLGWNERCGAGSARGRAAEREGEWQREDM